MMIMIECKYTFTGKRAENAKFNAEEYNLQVYKMNKGTKNIKLSVLSAFVAN